MKNMKKLKKKKLFRNINEKIIWESENIFHLFSDVSRYGKILSHYEVYKKIKELPGDIMELGVFKGVSFNQFLTFKNLLKYSKSRKIFRFDSFGQFPKPQNKIDNKFFI